VLGCSAAKEEEEENNKNIKKRTNTLTPCSGIYLRNLTFLS
jgi:hypothetical protein